MVFQCLPAPDSSYLSGRTVLCRIRGWLFRHLSPGALLIVYLLSLMSIGAMSANGASSIPKGVFSLGRVGESANSAVLADRDVDGISIRQPWRQLEKSPGVFDWRFLDSEVARAAKAGKMVLVRILSEGWAVPQWEYAKGVQTFDFEDDNPYHREKTGRVVVYWDHTFMADKRAMTKAVGDHLSGNPAVRVVAAICASAQGGDWHVPHTHGDILHWRSIGYSPEKLIEISDRTIDDTMQSFPGQCVTLAVNPNGRLDPDPDYVVRAIAKYAQAHYPGRFVLQKNSLSAITPVPGSPDLGRFQVLWDFRPDVAGQMLWYSYGDPTFRNNGRQPGNPEAVLRRAIETGLAYQMQYIEIYQEDILHFPAVARYAHDALTK
jgi:hypothetical protein